MSIAEQLDEFKQWLNDKQRTGMRLAEAFHDIVQRYEAALRAQPAAEGQTLTFTDEHVSYVEHYGGNCRDCADENGTCPNRGHLPCGKNGEAIRFVFRAIEYGARHGFVASPTHQQPGAEGREADESTLADMAHSANQEALSFGVSFDVFMRLARSVAALPTHQQPAAEQAQEQLETEAWVALCKAGERFSGDDPTPLCNAIDRLVLAVEARGEKPEAQAPQGVVAWWQEWGDKRYPKPRLFLASEFDPSESVWIDGIVHRPLVFGDVPQPAAGQAAQWCANCGEGTTQGLCRAKPADPGCRFVAGQAVGVVGLSDEAAILIGKRALDKCHGTDAQHIYIAREVERYYGIRPASSEGEAS